MVSQLYGVVRVCDSFLIKNKDYEKIKLSAFSSFV